MREILQSIDVMNATGSVAALLLCCVSGGAQADQQAGVERLSTEFSTASEAPRGSYALVERDETILAVDLSPQKLALARELGATHAFNAADADVLEAIREATHGGVDFAFEMAGSVKAMELAYKITRRGGSTVTAGLSHPQAMFSVPHVNIVAEERSIRGSYLGSCVPSRDIPRYIEWYQQGRLPVGKLLSETLPLDALNGGFDRLARGEGVRQVVLL